MIMQYVCSSVILVVSVFLERDQRRGAMAPVSWYNYVTDACTYFSLGPLTVPHRVPNHIVFCLLSLYINIFYFIQFFVLSSGCTMCHLSLLFFKKLFGQRLGNWNGIIAKIIYKFHFFLIAECC